MEKINYEKYFEILEEQIKCLYKDYKEALKVFNYLNQPINADFFYPLAIATNNSNFKLIHENKEGWTVIIANASFVFGDSGKVRIVEEKK